MSRSFLSEIFSFLRGQPNHPIYHKETAGWAYVRAWRGLRRGCLPLMALIMVSTSCCCGLMIFPTILDNSPSDTPTILFFTLPIILLLGVLSGGEIINVLTGFVATVLTATTISAEIEAQTYPLLRLTAIHPRQIMLAKLGAAFNQIRLPIITIMVARLVSIAGGVLLLVLYVIVQAESAFLPQEVLEIWAQIVPHIPGIVSLLISGLVWLICHALLKPVVDMLLFLTIGLFASSFTRTRSGGLFAAGGIRVALWVASYILSQIASSFLSLATMPLAIMAGSAPDAFEELAAISPNLWMLGAAVTTSGMVIIMIVLEFVLTLILLRITQNRVEQLPFAGI
ncbi:MAG: hypothetical protein JXB07_14600 [Anaerolineae bacterium]|nr:hypothetical protein [Anaerolineae bacterium]